MLKEHTLIQLEKFLIGLSFFMPLVVLPSSFIFPFIVPKILIFRTIVLVMLAAYALLLRLNWQKYRPRLTVLNIAVLGFWLSFAISTFVGVDPYRSFWDNHERMLGLFTVTHYVLFYFIIIATVRSREEWKLLLRWFLGAGALVMFVAVLQKINPEILLNRGSGRVSSTLGNPIYVSGYGLFLLFFAVLQYVQTSKHETTWRYVAAGVAVLGFAGIFLGGTRGTFLGLLTAIAVLLLIFAIRTTSRTYRLGIIGIAVMGVLALSGSFILKDSAIVQSITPLKRLVSLDIANIEYNTRIMAWGIAWESFFEKPVFGWGPNNYYYAFNEYYRPEFLRYGYGETWFDNAHNIVMNTLSTQGAFGIVTYLAVFISAGILLFRTHKRGNITDVEFGLLLAFMVGHFVHNIFVFENPTSYLYFFFALGYIAVRTHTATDDATERQYHTLSTPLVIVTGGVLLLSIYLFTLIPANANTATLRAIQAVYQGRGVAEYELAASIGGPHIDDVRNDFARTVSQVVPQLVEARRGDDAIELIDLSLTELEKNQVLHPLDIRVHLMMSQLYQQRASINKNSADIVLAIEQVESARKYSPKRQQIHFTLGNMYAMTGNTSTAEGLFRESRDLDPVVGEGWLQLARYYSQVGDVSSSIAVAQEALSTTPTIRFRDDGKQVIESILNR